MFRNVLFIILFFPLSLTISTTCICTTVECPTTGQNNITMGNGYANIDYIYSYHSNHPVVISAIGTLSPDALDHGTETTSCTQQYARMLEDDGEKNCDAGHILANRLGGYGNIPTNIFPQNAGSNRGVYAQFEGNIYNYIQNNNINATLEWYFLYKSTAYTMPYSVNYSAVFEDGYSINSLFQNIF